MWNKNANNYLGLFQDRNLLLASETTIKKFNVSSENFRQVEFYSQGLSLEIGPQKSVSQYWLPLCVDQKLIRPSSTTGNNFALTTY